MEGESEGVGYVGRVMEVVGVVKRQGWGSGVVFVVMTVVKVHGGRRGRHG